MLCRCRREGLGLDGQLWRLRMLGLDEGLLYWRTASDAAPPRTPARLVDRSKSWQEQALVAWEVRLAGPFSTKGPQLVFLEVLRRLRAASGAGRRPAASALDSPQGRSGRLPGMRQKKSGGGLVRNGLWTPASVDDIRPKPEACRAFGQGEPPFYAQIGPTPGKSMQKPGSAVAGMVAITTMVAEPGSRRLPPAGSWGLSVLRGSAIRRSRGRAAGPHR